MKYFSLRAIAILFFIAPTCFALMEHEKLWLGLNAQFFLSEDKKWHSFLFTQSRFINENHPWQTILVESGLGYMWQPGASMWFGYRWSGQNPTYHFDQENRLFQQVLWKVDPDKQDSIIFRIRLEELQRSNENQVALRLRQRIALEVNHSLFTATLFPFIYNEFFFQLNKTRFTPDTFFGENRLFIGFNLHHAKNAWWEIGYMNQFQEGTPQNRENQLSHILSVTYNFV